jgi:transmembrane sensor
VSYTADERRIELLRGEALFDVVPDRQKPFRVLAQGGVTQAVGTAFAVHAQDRQTQVVVTKGTVAVSTAMEGPERGSTVTVQKNQQTIYRQDRTPSAVQAVEGDSLVAWARGSIVIERQPFARAMAELNRYRSGRIVVLADLSRTKPVSGRFTIAGIDDAIVALASTQHLKVLRITDYLILIL